MKPVDPLVPYMLASMHPLLHMGLLVTSLLLVSLDHDKFYEVPGTCPAEYTDAVNFMTENKYWLMFSIMTGHLSAILLHYLYQVLNHYDYKTAANLALVTKVTSFFWIIVSVQTGITFEECTEVTDNSHVMAWLTYEIVAFYLNIISTAVFLVIATLTDYKTIKERLGYAGNARKHQDFLYYCIEEIHYWQAWFTQVMLFFAGLLFRVNNDVTIGLSAMQIAVIVVLGAFLMKNIYFSDTFEFTTASKVILAGDVLVCLMMIPRYFYLRDNNSIWWAPVVLEVVIAHLVIFVQMAIEYSSWNNKKIKWQKELMFHQQFKKQSDVSETLLQKHINMLSLNPDAPVPADEDGEKKSKTIAIAPTYYSCTYFALMKTNKQKYKLKEADQAEMFYHTGILVAIQLLFLGVLYYTALPKFKYIRDTKVNFVLFFSVFLMHSTVLPTAKNGMNMMKYALMHSDEFNHPMSAFCIGVYVFVTLVVAEVAMIASAQDKKDVVGAVTGFIAYGAINSIPSLYLNSFEDLPVKSAVGKVELKRSRKSKDRPLMKADWLFDSIYVVCNVFYKTVFFYFFPLATIFTPMIRSLEGNINL